MAALRDLRIQFRICLLYQECVAWGKGDFAGRGKWRLQGGLPPLQWCLDTIFTKAALKGLSMEKWMCWTGLGVSGVVFLVFLLDMITGLPLGLPEGGTSITVRILAMLACGLVAYVSWDALQDQR
jgi:hypothetical protein